MMHAPYKAVVFDLDGTVADTLNDLTASVNRSLAAFGYPTHTKKEVSTFVGNGIKMLVVRALPQGVEEGEINKVYAYFMEDYAAHHADSTLPYPGVMQLLSALKARGVKLALVSNKADEMTQPLISRFFPGVFAFVLGSRDDLPRKPDPTGYLLAMQSLGVERAETCYVGDSEVDVQTAANAGTDVVLVSWGFRTKEQLYASGAPVVADTMEELFSLLTKNA